jgi:MATE family multidrug resistance protein
VLAANAVLLNFLTFAAFGLDGFAHAAEAMVGRHVGRGDAVGFRAATRANLMLALALAVALALGFAGAGRTAIDLMTGLAEVRATAVTYLPYIVALPLVAVFAFLFDGVFIGATRTAEMRNGMALALGVFLGAVALLAPLGNHGLWLAMVLFMAARGVWLGACYLYIARGHGFVGAPGQADVALVVNGARSGRDVAVGSPAASAGLTNRFDRPTFTHADE